MRYVEPEMEFIFVNENVWTDTITSSTNEVPFIPPTNSVEEINI